LKSFGMFDITAFGLQYPREYLVVIAEAIAKVFPDQVISEQVDILKKLFSILKVEKEDGTFIYPPRGVGLGYYEDLKTIGIMSIMDGLDVISLYGDQALIAQEDAREAFKRLRVFGFSQKPSKEKIGIRTVKWSGSIMTENSVHKPREYLEEFQSIFDGEFHWERKNLMASFYEKCPEVAERVNRYLSLQYRLIFGYEFNKSEYKWSLEDGGLDLRVKPNIGYNRTYRISQMKSPRDIFLDNLAYTSPFFVEWKRTEAREFSLKRKRAWRDSPLFPSWIYEYSHPKISLNKTKKPKQSILQSSVTEMMDLRLVASCGVSMGRVTHDLFGDSLYRAIFQCSRASNPFEAYATGGYSVTTPWRGPAYISEEVSCLVKSLYWNLDKMYNFYTPREGYDRSLKPIIPEIRGPKRKLDEPPKYPSWGGVPTGFERSEEGYLIRKRVKFDSLSKLIPCESKGHTVGPVTDLLSDLRGRFKTDFKEAVFDFREDDCSDLDSLISDYEDIDSDFYESDHEVEEMS